MEFEKKMMYKVFWIDGSLKEAFFETKQDAADFKMMMYAVKPSVKVYINKWTWTVIIEK